MAHGHASQWRWEVLSPASVTSRGMLSLFFATCGPRFHLPAQAPAPFGNGHHEPANEGEALERQKAAADRWSPPLAPLVKKVWKVQNLWRPLASTMTWAMLMLVS